MPQHDSSEDVFVFEVPDYQLTREHAECETVELFVSPDKEQMMEQLNRPVVDVQSVKVML